MCSLIHAAPHTGVLGCDVMWVISNLNYGGKIRNILGIRALSGGSWSGGVVLGNGYINVTIVILWLLASEIAS